MDKQGKAIKKALKAKELSQAEFSRRLGISPSHTSKVINGTRRLGIKQVLAVSRILGIPLEALLP